MMNSLTGQFLFFSVFHLIGGAAFGAGLRGLRRGLGAASIFFLIWGGGFGGMPLLIGYSVFHDLEKMWLVGVEALEFVGAMLLVAFIPDWILEIFKSTQVSTIAFGGVFFLIGAIAGVASFQSDPLFALLFGGAFAGSGLFVMAVGVRSLLKS